MDKDKLSKLDDLARDLVSVLLHEMSDRRLDMLAATVGILGVGSIEIRITEIQQPEG